MNSLPDKIIIVTAPSGSGKTTLVKRLIAALPQLCFSVSACTREPRKGETAGKDYHYLTAEKFQELIEADQFLEWEMVYPGKYYGTLRSEVDRIQELRCIPLIDVDVKGALHVKKAFGRRALSVFIQAPTLEILKQRLEGRGTETPESMAERISKAAYESGYAHQFDSVVINDDVDLAAAELLQLVEGFLEGAEVVGRQ